MKLIKNYLYNVVFQIFSIILPLITTPYVSRIFGPSLIGVYAQTFVIVSYFVLIAGLGVNIYGNREIAFVRDDKNQLNQTFWEIIVMRIITVTVVFVCFIFLLVFYQFKYKEILLIQSINILAVALDISWFFLGLEDFKTNILRNVIVKLLLLFFIFLLIHDLKDIYLYVGLMGGATFLGNLVFWPHLKKFIYKPDKPLKLFRHFKSSLILFIPQIMISVYGLVSKNMLAVMDSNKSLGLFENSDKISNAALILVTSSCVVLIPRLANNHAKNDNALVKSMVSKSFDFVSFLAIPITFCLMSVAESFSLFFFGFKFQGIGIVLFSIAPVIIMIGWKNTLGIQYLISIGKEKDFIISAIIGSLVNILLSFILIPILGAVGAAVSLVISEFLIIVYQAFIIRKDLNIISLFLQTWKYFFAGIVMSLVIKFLSFFTKGILGLFIQILLGAIVYFLLTITMKSNFTEFCKKNLRNLL
ncbi:MAG: oligosaccharide flippase family protein [Elusimicrobiota bacterium]|jgi:O-antigen/teichoic acid export membrane protein|nr:oligosaccharide flippase family protein [Elusimicrobiota bacterium]